MKHIKYILLLFLAASLALPGGCTDNNIIDGPDENIVLPDGTEFETSFGGFANGMSVTQLRATGNDPDQLTSLRLLVFDEHRHFLYSRVAVLGSIVPDNKPDADHLPDGTKDNIEKMMAFNVSLISSTKTRYIHFVANHDWNGFPQDYFLEGVSDGELIGGMRTQKTEFWRMLKFEGLQESSLNGKVVKLLRNNAKVSVSMKPEVTDFTYEGFTVYHAPDKATVAPFVFNESDFSYQFPITPDAPTIPAGTARLTAKPIGKYENGYELFEHLNTGADTTNFVIMKGTLAGKRTGYYKIDLTKFNSATGVTSLYDVVRNYHYRVIVGHIANEGYATAEEAARKPAGNNLFASVELADYPSVSDGKSTLEIEHLGGTFVRAPDIFTTKLFYTHGMTNVKFYPSWNTENDEYVGGLTVAYEDGASDGTLSVDIKKVPDDRELAYGINVVGISPADGSIITREITLRLRSPYNFNQKIVSAGTTAGSKVTVTFEVPKTMSKSAIPFDVLIETKELTPDLGAGLNNGMILVIQDGKYYYRYSVKDVAAIGTTISLNFIRNQDNAVEEIKMTSEYYNPATLQLGNVDAVRGRLTFGTSNNAQRVPQDAALEISYNGGAFVSGASNTVGITAVMTEDQGNHRLVIDKDKIPQANYDNNLTIRYNRVVTNAYGSVTYDNETTKTISQWLADADALLERYSVVVRGRMTAQGGALGLTNNVTVTPGSITVNAAQSGYNPYTLTLTGANVTANSFNFRYVGNYSITYIATRSLQELEVDARVNLQ